MRLGVFGSLSVTSSSNANSVKITAAVVVPIPSKIEGLAFGPDIKEGTTTIHTLWIGNDNDFVQTVNDVNGNPIPNPNQIFVFGFTDADLDGSVFVPQKFSGSHFGW